LITDLSTDVRRRGAQKIPHRAALSVWFALSSLTVDKSEPVACRQKVVATISFVQRENKLLVYDYRRAIVFTLSDLTEANEKCSATTDEVECS